MRTLYITLMTMAALIGCAASFAQIMTPDQFKKGVLSKSQQQNQHLNQELNNSLSQQQGTVNAPSNDTAVTEQPPVDTVTTTPTTTPPAPANGTPVPMNNTAAAPTPAQTPAQTAPTTSAPAPSAPYTGFGGNSNTPPSSNTNSSQWNVNY